MGQVYLQWKYIVLTEQSCVSSQSGVPFPRETCKKGSIDCVEWVIERELLFYAVFIVELLIKV